ncbi:MAG TPA: AAA+ family ATPase [Cyanobacteria bacterium UBA8553]|nr:AAA+ family ATPase [Cyanobacteria bacterium UBA8553]HAJ59636.1 AAA+ family ATPase [Cyanobacteria bacterium UBA8543]
MVTPSAASIQSLQVQAASLLLYQSVLCECGGKAFVNLLQALHQSDRDPLNCLHAYGSWFKTLAASTQSWQDYLLTQILRDDNPFSQQAQDTAVEHLPPALIAAARQDLQALHSLYQCSSEQLSNWVKAASQLPVAPIPWHLEQNVKEQGFAVRGDSSVNEQLLREKLKQLDNWADAVEDLAAYYRQCGTGLFAQYRALRWQLGQLIGIAHPDRVQLTELVGYESQQDALVKNTEFLLADYPALHVLLYGSRGSGKSSLVKGLLNQYYTHGLRLIEVAKSDLKDLPVIVEQLRNLAQKFIIFVDDLSFEEDDDAFKALKVVLEGSVTARSQNVVVYATSNRRHLIREFFGDRPRPRDGDEVHAWDTLQEKLSFSDRFGLTLTFEPANQDTYLKIVRHLAAQAGISLTQDDLDYRALQWATRHNGRSGRTARQFIDFLQADLALLSQGSRE